MKSLTFFTVLCSIINAGIVLGITTSKTIPDNVITTKNNYVNETTNSSSLKVINYTTTLSYYGYSTKTILPNTIKVKSITGCIPTKGYVYYKDEYCEPYVQVKRDTEKSTTTRVTTTNCKQIVSSYYKAGTHCFATLETLTTTIPVKTGICAFSTTDWNKVTRYKTIIETLTSTGKTIPTSTGKTIPTSTGKTIPISTSTTIPIMIDKETTIINNNVRTVVEIDYVFSKPTPKSTVVDCILAKTTSLKVIPSIATSSTTTSSTNLPTKTTTSSVSFPPKTTTTSSVSFPSKTTTTSSVSFPPKTTTTSSVSFPPKTTTTSSVSFPPKTTTTSSVSFPPKTTTTSSVSFPPKTTTTTSTSSVTLPPKTTTKCIPVTVTITEKVKVTTTLKETITVTVKSSPTNENCADKYAQCGGNGFSGPTCCKSGSTCHKYNEYYSQCI